MMRRREEATRGRFALNHGLLLWLPVFGDANDHSGRGNNGSVASGTLVVGPFGQANRVYSFNGITGKITVPNAPSLAVGSHFCEISTSVWRPFTVLFWLKRAGGNQGICEHGSAVARTYNLHTRFSGTQIEVSYNNLARTGSHAIVT